jgi:outer membrane protein assembly factor BamB
VTARPLRTVVVVVIAVAATWFVARPAFGAHAHRGEGAVQWEATLPDGPSDLAADAQGIVVTTSAPSVYALNPDGRVRWRVPVDDLALGQPALDADLAAVGGMHSVTALDRGDGAVRWQRPTVAPANSIAVVAHTVLVGDDSGTLAALDAASGTPRWSVQHPGALWSGARVDVPTGSVVATWHQGDRPAVRVLDLATGALRWEAPTDRYTAAPAVGTGVVALAIGDGERHARVEVRDLVTGARRWETPVPASFEEAIEPAIAGGTVAVVDHFGVVSLFDLASGRLRWQHDLADVLIATRVTITGHRIALTSYAGVLYVLDARDGHVVTRLTPDRLGGLPAATVRAPGRGPARLLLAVRLRDWGVQLRRLP